MLKDHSPLTPNTHPQQKGLNLKKKKKHFANDRELLIFWVPCLFLGAAFPFSLINPTLCADLVIP
jgi:hypothetical protein